MEDKIGELYRLLRLGQYRALFSRVKEKAGSLSATEAFTAEVIYLLDGPTLGELADFLGISQPNATYKVNALAAKGYIEKAAGETDRRALRLHVTERFYDYYGGYMPAVKRAFLRACDSLTSAERAVIERFLALFTKEARSI